MPRFNRESALAFDTMAKQLDLALAVARASDRNGYARAELAIAEQKISTAREAARRFDYTEADRRLVEGYIDLELARLRAEEARMNAELQRHTATGARSHGR
jgi:hypothetical protein